MAHEVFVSYSSKDKAVADAVCAALEARGIRCWIAPRDVEPGADWDEMNVRAITESRVMVLVFSTRANESQQVRRKVNLAAERGVPVVPFRIENVTPSGPLKKRLDAAHWLDALTPPLEAHTERLADDLTPLLKERGGRPLAETAEGPVGPPPGRRSVNKILLTAGVLGLLALAALIGVLAYRWNRSGGAGDGGVSGQALHCTPPENYELRCRGGGEMKLSLDESTESGRRLLKIRFKRGPKPATEGLNPGECSWVDRAFKEEEPDTIIRYVSGPNVPVVTSLKDANKYWGFCASNHGDYFGVLESGRGN